MVAVATGHGEPGMHAVCVWVGECESSSIKHDGWIFTCLHSTLECEESALPLIFLKCE